MSILRDIVANTANGVTEFITTATIGELIIESDPSRFAIGFATLNGSQVVVTTNPNNPVGIGIPIPSTGIVWITAKDHGSFAQSAWYNTGGVAVCLLSVFTLRFPKE